MMDNDEWQPIETAPKDGTPILVFGKPQKHPNLESWYDGSAIFTAEWDAIDESFCILGGDWLGPFIDPSHWMPLPAPPKAK